MGNSSLFSDGLTMLMIFIQLMIIGMVIIQSIIKTPARPQAKYSLVWLNLMLTILIILTMGRARKAFFAPELISAYVILGFAWIGICVILLQKSVRISQGGKRAWQVFMGMLAIVWSIKLLNFGVGLEFDQWLAQYAVRIDLLDWIWQMLFNFWLMGYYLACPRAGR